MKKHDHDVLDGLRQLASLDLITLGLKVSAAPFQGSSVLAEIRLYLRLRPPR